MSTPTPTPTPTTTTSMVRQNFDQENEARVNMQINVGLRTSYIYHSLAAYFARDTIALHGLSKFFATRGEQEHEQSHKFKEYMNLRGGRVLLQDIGKPEHDEWGTSLDALEMALHLQKEVTQTLLEMHQLATSKSDVHLTHFIEDECLDKQIESIRQLGDMITQLKRAGLGLGEHIFDKDLQEA